MLVDEAMWLQCMKLHEVIAAAKLDRYGRPFFNFLVFLTQYGSDFRKELASRRDASGRRVVGESVGRPAGAEREYDQRGAKAHARILPDESHPAGRARRPGSCPRKEAKRRERFDSLSALNSRTGRCTAGRPCSAASRSRTI